MVTYEDFCEYRSMYERSVQIIRYVALADEFVEDDEDHIRIIRGFVPMDSIKNEEAFHIYQIYVEFEDQKELCDE